MKFFRLFHPSAFISAGPASFADHCLVACNTIIQCGVEFCVLGQFYNGGVFPRRTQEDNFIRDKLPAQGGEHCLRVFGIRLTNNNDLIRWPQAKVYGAEQLREGGGVLSHRVSV